MICTPASIEVHRKDIESLAAGKEEKERKAAELEKEKMSALANLFVPAVRKSEAVWSSIFPLVMKETAMKFDSIVPTSSQDLCARDHIQLTLLRTFRVGFQRSMRVIS